jgi:ATP-binding cassette subfamily B protein
MLFELGAESIVDRLEEKLGERGATLSSGERQIVSLARALVTSPELLVLDEATANIDPETERIVQRATEKALEGRTAIVIAHRLSTIKAVDRIIVIHKGRIEESGTLDELLEKSGLFYKLYTLQYGDIKNAKISSSD